MRYAIFGRLFLIAMSISLRRGLLQRHMLPKSGEGPSKAVCETGSYELAHEGEMPESTFLKARITGQGDQGVRSTTLMLIEAALCLAEDADKLTVGGGFWTPAAAMGKLLRDRITAHAGLTFELIDAKEA